MTSEAIEFHFLAIAGGKIPKIVVMLPEKRNLAGGSFNYKTDPKT